MTVAIRNGKSSVITEHIVLDVDRFGKVSVEDDKWVKNINTTNNISAAVWEKKASQADK